jgi:hypothetical protein
VCGVAPVLGAALLALCIDPAPPSSPARSPLCAGGVQEDFKVQLAGLEKQLLEALATSEGDILENTALIESLTRTKSKSAEIAAALQEVRMFSSISPLVCHWRSNLRPPFRPRPLLYA